MLRDAPETAGRPIELQTQSPFGDQPHHVTALACGVNRCRATSPCNQHEQVIVRLRIDGLDYPEFKLGKPAFHELTELHRDPRELFHMLATFAIDAAQAEWRVNHQPSIADLVRNGLNGAA